MLFTTDHVAARDIRERFVHKGPRPCEIILLLDGTFRDPLIDELTRRLLDRGEVAARDMGMQPCLLFGRERASCPHCTAGQFHL